MGSAEFKSVKVTDGEHVIDLTDAGARNGRIFLYYPGQLAIKMADGCEASLISEKTVIHILSLSNRIRNGKNTVRLAL